MKLINESIILKNGSKIYDFKNLIMNCYLETFIDAQISSENLNNVAKMLSVPSVALKFDTPLEIEEDSEFFGEDFDVFSLSANDNQILQTISNRQITTQYKYPLEQQVLKHLNDSFTFTDLNSEFAGRKLTAIAFFPIWMCILGTGTYRIPARAVLDVSSYNIYIEENMPVSITRKDTIISDMEFYSPYSDIKGFIHLIPNKNGLTNYEQNRQYGVLHSIGISSSPTIMDNEYIIGEDVSITRKAVGKLNFSEIENLYNPRKILPSVNLFPGNNLKPTKSSLNYIIFKYNVYEAPNGTYIDTGKYYYAIKKVDFTKSDWIDIQLKYERGN